ncbi:sugar ABC transporter ATPase [Aeromonas diversa CDC 2478-85]|uniref:Sugar ABC transporter ATPase n=1 Tax=Aeromonas diversa CDC 2478-85 TaxID=1268237 RepID=N9U4E3_9GAMM|nr:ABC transporter substrate binding protein [Aeromonas diversa]ENY73250.1 sugar ABC transporter ATPase [Aeromonas diversa CDC 2478-85]
MKPMLFLLLLITAQSLQAGKLLIISSYHPDYAWDISYNEGLLSQLKGAHEISRFYLDTKRLPRERFDQQAADALAFYRKTRPDWVLLSDDNAIDYLAHPIADAGTPVVFLGMNESPRNHDMVGHRNITGVLERPLLKRNIQEMSRMMGGLDKVLVLFDSSDVSLASIDDEFRTQTSLRIGQTLVTISLIGQYPLWQQIVQSAKGQGFQAIFIGLYHTLTDAQGKHVNESEVLHWSSQHSPLPLFCFWEFAVGKGKTAGGLVLNGREQGVMAADLLNAIMAGARPESISPRAAQRGKYIFSRSELARWKLTPPAQWADKVEWQE